MKKLFILFLSLGILAGCTPESSQFLSTTSVESIPSFVLEAISEEINKPVGSIRERTLMSWWDFLIYVVLTSVDDLTALKQSRNLIHLDI